jgi:hypothetical protein
MTNKKLNILKEHLKFKKSIKYEWRQKLLKSILHNKNLPPLTRILSQKQLTNQKLFFFKKQICHISGSYININKKLKISRFTIKNLILNRTLDNIINDA